MKHLLDTDHISILQTRSEPGYSIPSSRMRRESQEDVGYCVISYHEQVIGIHAYPNRGRTASEVAKGYDRLSRLAEYYWNRVLLEFDDRAATAYDDLRSRNIKVGAMDLRIAAIALSRGLVLLTRSRRDFDKVPKLETEDWTN